MNINEFVNSVNDPRLKNAVRKIGNSPEGQNLLKNLTDKDRQNLLNQIGKINASGITADLLLRQLNNNPNIINQLQNMLGKKR